MGNLRRHRVLLCQWLVALWLCALAGAVVQGCVGTAAHGDTPILAFSPADADKPQPAQHSGGCAAHCQLSLTIPTFTKLIPAQGDDLALLAVAAIVLWSNPRLAGRRQVVSQARVGVPLPPASDPPSTLRYHRFND